MSLQLYREPAFCRDLKKYIKRGYDIGLFRETISLICSDTENSRKILTQSYHDHCALGKYKADDIRECHIGKSGDWLLLYRV